MRDRSSYMIMQDPSSTGTSPGSEELSRRAREVIPHGVNSPVRHYDPYPFYATRSDGSRIWDADGRELVDLCNGYGAMLLGHRHPDIVRAVTDQIAHGTLFCVPTQLETEVSEMIAGNYPSVDLARMVNTGSEATMTAIRLARGYTGRPKIVTFEGGYHGAHDSVLVRAGSGSAHLGVPASEGGLPGVSSQTIVARYNDPAGLAEIIESHDNEIAAVIMEPVMANMGLIPPKDGFLEEVRRMTRQHGILLIFDEVVTGFRMSQGGAQRYYHVTPDLTTLAKALGNGFAAAAIGGRRDIMEMLAPGGNVYQASTFAGNPVAAAAAAASIRTINGMAGTLYGDLERICGKVASAVDEIASDLGIPHRVHHISSMMQVFFSDGDVYDYRTAKRSDAARFREMFDGLLENGTFVAPSQYETVFFSAALNREDVVGVVESYRTSLERMRR